LRKSKSQLTEYQILNPKPCQTQEITKDKEPFIFSQQFGVAFTANRFVFDIAAIFHTLDDKEMVQTHQWGTVTGLYRFK